VAVLTTAVIVVRICSLASIIAKARLAACAGRVVPAWSLLLDGAVTTMVQELADFNAAAKILELLHMATHVLLMACGRMLVALVHVATSRLFVSWTCLATIFAIYNTPRA